ncbi:MAG: TIGR03619 family F420-dependent LLM class oxidoreductase [Actinomycetes bacterium]
MTSSLPELGFALPVSGPWATPEAMVRVARAAEQAGYRSLWTFQRLLHPLGADWGPMYRSVHDPLVTLAYVAAVTDRVRLGVAVVNAPYYAPIVLAKQLTSLDVVSHGRLDVGLGIGWAAEEFEAAGASMRGRGARAEELVACLEAIWDDDPVEFRGKHYRVPASEVDPKPVQRPHPPLLLGGAARPALERAGRIADGWVSASRHDLTRIGEGIAVVRAAARGVGRDDANLRFVVRGVVLLGQEVRNRDGQRRPLTGGPEQVRQDLATLAEQGVTEVFLDPNFDPEIGNPAADPQGSERSAMHLLETFAPSLTE